MDIIEAMNARHSVRHYQKKAIEQDKVEQLYQEIDQINQQHHLHFQLILNEPHAFESFFVHYGRFKNVQNYIALVGHQDDQEKIGYYGESLVLKAQQVLCCLQISRNLSSQLLAADYLLKYD